MPHIRAACRVFVVELGGREKKSQSPRPHCILSLSIGDISRLQEVSATIPREQRYNGTYLFDDLIGT